MYEPDNLTTEEMMDRMVNRVEIPGDQNDLLEAMMRVAGQGTIDTDLSITQRNQPSTDDITPAQAA